MSWPPTQMRRRKRRRRSRSGPPPSASGPSSSSKRSSRPRSRCRGVARLPARPTRRTHSRRRRRRRAASGRRAQTASRPARAASSMRHQRTPSLVRRCGARASWCCGVVLGLLHGAVREKPHGVGLGHGTASMFMRISAAATPGRRHRALRTWASRARCSRPARRWATPTPRPSRCCSLTLRTGG